MGKHKYGDNNKEMEALTGLTPKSLTGYTKIYPAMMLHEVAEQTLDSDNGGIKSCKFSIPKVGEVFVTRSDTEGIKYDFNPDVEFEKSLVRVMTTGKSPLLKILETSVVSMINKKYEDLL